MPFGLQNSSASFQPLMNRVIGDMQGCAVYFDDVVIYSDTCDVHLERVRELFFDTFGGGKDHGQPRKV